MPEFSTPDDVFNAVNTRLQSDPSKVSGTNATYLFDLSGEGGGPYHIALHGDAGEAGKGAVDNPNITISMAANDLVDLATGKLDGTMAFMSGKIKIKGDMGLAMRLQSLFS